MDYGGMVWFSAVIVVLLTFLLSLPQGVNVYLLAITIGMGIGLYGYEKRLSQPFIDVTFLKNNSHISSIYLQFILVNAVFYSCLFGIPSYLQDVQQFDASTVGFIMLSIAGFGVVSTPLAGWWADRVGPAQTINCRCSYYAVGHDKHAAYARYVTCVHHLPHPIIDWI